MGRGARAEAAGDDADQDRRRLHLDQPRPGRNTGPRPAWLAKAQAIISSDEYDLVVLDEFTYLMDFGWLDADAVIDWLNAHKPPRQHLLITGRNAPPALIDYAILSAKW